MIFLGVVVFVVVAVVAIIWLEVAFRGDRGRTEREEEVRRWQPPFARGGDLVNWARSTTARTVGKWLAGKPTAATPSKLAAELHEGATRAMLPLAPERETRRTVACPEEGQGMIGITAPEAIEIADYIRRNLSRAERDRIYDLALENAKKMADLGHTQLSVDETPCPLQGDDCVCRTYEARPLRCRPLHAATIARQLGLETSGAAGEIPPWASHMLSIEQGVEEGLIRSLESAGLDANLYELNDALVTALDTPDAAERWKQGDGVFAFTGRR